MLHFIVLYYPAQCPFSCNSHEYGASLSNSFSYGHSKFRQHNFSCFFYLLLQCFYFCNIIEIFYFFPNYVFFFLLRSHCCIASLVQGVVRIFLNTVLIPYLNLQLRRGFPLPIIHGFTLQNASILPTSSVMIVCSDVVFNESISLYSSF